MLGPRATRVETTGRGNTWFSLSVRTETNFCDRLSHGTTYGISLNPLERKGNYSAISNNMKLVHWPLMGGLLHFVQR